MGFPLDNVTVLRPILSLYLASIKTTFKILTWERQVITLLFEYPSFYTDFKHNGSRLEHMAVWYSTLVLHKFAVGWFPFELNLKSVFFSC